MNKDKMRIEIWSDIMCPFCYIGKRHFEKALAKFENREDVELEWKSFQLNPGLPNGGGPKSNAYEYLAKHKGISYQESVQIHQRVMQMAKEAGLDYHFEKTIIANSFNAHRVLQLAKLNGLGDQAEELFFHQYFTEGKDISDKQTLLELGAKLGFTTEQIDQALEQDEFAGLVNRDIGEARKLGVGGVPFFVFNRKYAVSGAQQPELFLQTLHKAYADWRKENPAVEFEQVDGKACSPGGDCA